MPDNQATPDSEQLLIRIWRAAFARNDITATDDFFDLRGDSLIAATIAAGIEDGLDLRISFRIFFDQPVLKDMAAEIDRLRERSARLPKPAPLTAVPRDSDIPISTLQRWPWWEMSREPGVARHAAFAFTFRIEGDLNVEALARALDFVVARHEGLRTRFEVSGDDVRQIVEPPFNVDLAIFDLSDSEDTRDQIQEHVNKSNRTVYDLAKIPLFEFKLLRITDMDHRLVLGLHHILFDDVSLMILINGIAGAYSAYRSGSEPAEPEQRGDYADFAAMQRREWNSGSAKFKVAVAWWKQHYRKAVDAADFDSLRPLMLEGYDGRSQPLRDVIHEPIDPEISRNLSELARKQSATAYCARFAVAAAVLAHASRCELVILGNIMTSRYRLGLDHVFGPFAQSLPLMVRCDRDGTFHDLIDRARGLLANAQDYAEAPIWDIVTELDNQRSLVPSPPFIVNQVTYADRAEFSGLRLTSEDMANDALPSRSIWIRFDRHGDRETCNLTYDPNIYDANAIKSLSGNFSRFMSAASRKSDSSLGTLIDESCEPF